MKNKKKQYGVTLMEMILVVGLLATMTINELMEKKLKMEQESAKIVGSQLFTYNNAVRKWISENSDTTPLDVTFDGTNWLKAPSCGGTSTNPQGYLACDFPEASTTNRLRTSNISLSTRILRTFTPEDGVMITATTTTTPYQLAKRTAAGSLEWVARADLSGLAALAAASGLMWSETPVSATTDTSFKSNPLTAVITAEVRNQAGLDPWLRTDGGNEMNNILSFNKVKDVTLRQVKGVSRIQSLAGEVLYIGNKLANQNAGNAAAEATALYTLPVNGGGGEALQPTTGVVVDADTRIYGELRSNGAIYALTGDIRAVTGSVNAALDVTAGRNIIAENNITAKNNTTAKAFYDIDNTAYFIDPDKTSVANHLAVVKISSHGTNIPVEINSDRLNITNNTGTNTQLAGRVNVDGISVVKNGKYIGLNHLLPDIVHKASWLVTATGQYVNKPSCDAGGIQRIVVVPQHIPTNNIHANEGGGYGTPTTQGVTYFWATNASATQWIVYMRTHEYSYQGNPKALAHTYCQY